MLNQILKDLFHKVNDSILVIISQVSSVKVSFIVQNILTEVQVSRKQLTCLDTNLPLKVRSCDWLTCDTVNYLEGGPHVGKTYRHQMVVWNTIWSRFVKFWIVVG